MLDSVVVRPESTIDQENSKASMMHVVDLTLTLRSGMRGVEFEKLHTINEHGWNSRMLHLYSHSGTHVDAPMHFGVADVTIEAIPLDRFVAPAWVVDLPKIEPSELITVSHLGATADRVTGQEGLLLRTGWSKHALRDPEQYRDRMPRVSRELAEWCVERRVRMLGVETPSVASVNSHEEVTMIHQILLGNQVIVVEGLANLSALQEERVLFCAMPLKIEGGDGAPCRAFAVEGVPWANFPG
ncbi:MAG: cyclase family protein [Planctomycetaceae bacterium]